MFTYVYLWLLRQFFATSRPDEVRLRPFA